MNVNVLRLLSALFACAGVASLVQAQVDDGAGSVRISDQAAPASSLPPAQESMADGSYYSQDAGYYDTTPPEAIFAPIGRVDTRGGELYGYDEGYTNVGAFMPYYIEGDSALLFLDARGLVTNQGGGGANIGVGWRWFDERIDRIFGASAWYDHDNGHNFAQNQFGVSLESIGRYMDLRVNGYVPVSSETKTVSSEIFGDPFFQQNNIKLNRSSTVEFAYSGFDIETGGPFPILGRYGMSGYVGFYYFTGDLSSDFTGVSGRIQSQINEDLAINVQMTDDHKFGTNAQIQVVATLPNGWPTRWLRPLKVKDRLTQPVVRNYRVTTGTDELFTVEDALNPKDGLPYFVAHVDPNRAAPGNGTIENPYNTIAQFDTLALPAKSAFDIVYVTPRADDTSIGLSTGVTLLDCQRLLSTSVAHTFTSTQGTFDLPGFVSGAPLPILSNLGTATPGNVVTLADSNEVSGFIVDGRRSEDLNENGLLDPGEDLDFDGLIDSQLPLNNGIVSQVGGIESQSLLPIFNINRNNLRNVQNGILIESSDTQDAAGAIVENTITGDGFNSVLGASVVHSTATGTGDLNLLIRNNNVTGFQGEDRNSNGVLDLVNEDANGNGLLDAGEDLNGNGNLDLNEDLNGSGTLDRGIGIQAIADGTRINANNLANLTDRFPTTDEDTNMNGMLDPGEDTGNGVLDVGEDTNLNGMLDPGEDLGDGVLTFSPTGIANNVSTGNGTGMQLVADNGGAFFADVTGNTLNSNTDPLGAGFEAIADNGGRFSLDSYTGNSTNNNAGDGTRLLARAGGNLSTGDGNPATSDEFSANSYLNNGEDGLLVFADGGIINMERLTNNTFSGNGDDGAELRVDAGGLLVVDNDLATMEAQGAITGNTFTNNGANGLRLNAQLGTLIAAVGTPGQQTDPATNTFTNNTDNGLRLETATGGTLNSVVNTVVATGNGNAGISLFLDGGTINLDNTGLDPSLGNGIVGNNATGNGTDGMEIINDEGGIANIPRIQDNDFSNNTRAGLFFGGDGTGNVIDSFNNIGLIADNNFNRDTTGTVGILFDTTDVVTRGGLGVDTVLLRNTFVGRVGGVAGIDRGIGGNVNGGGVQFTLGNANVADSNTFTNNADAQIGLVFEGDSVNNFQVDNHTFTGTTDIAGTADFLGDGIVLIGRDTATLTGFIRRSTIQQNENDGVRIDITGNNLATFAQVNDFVIGGPTAVLGNTIIDNGGDGIEVIRTGTGQVNNMQILNNIVDNNAEDGLEITAANADLLDTYTVNLNEFTNSGLNGVRLHVIADADLLVDMDMNMITDNALDGILTTELVASATDTRSIQGIWTRNLIADNGDNGIELNAVSGDTSTAPFDLVIGDPTDMGLGNLIQDNAGSGIQMNGAGEVLIGSNTIRRNGTLGDLFTAGQDSGIDINALPFADIAIVNNDITENNGDGLEIVNPINIGTVQMVINDNIIDYNRARGVDILNRVDSTLRITEFNDNLISNNRLEGLYIVNTASGTQNQFNDSSVALAADGDINTSQNIELFADGNNILSNGVDINPILSASGLVVRVGTSQSFGGTTAPSGVADPVNGFGFASDGSFTPFSSSLAGVTMSFNNGNLGGNNGDDIWFHSYVSTASAGGTGTTFTEVEFNPTGYDADPLARLDLQFLGNTFEAHDVNNGAGVVTGNPGLVAFYNNADGVFKSRLNNIALPNLAGPFSAADRRRNAQRLQADLPFLNAPTVGPGANYAYPGTGPSTFRVQTDEVGVFFFDNVPFNDTFDDGGFIIPGAIGNGELGFGWTRLP